MTAKAWREMREDYGAETAVSILLDPGSLPGCSILDSKIETTEKGGTEETECRCDNCEWIGVESDLNEVRDLEQRLDFPPDHPDCTLPAGECPECGALAYRTDT